MNAHADIRGFYVPGAGMSRSLWLRKCLRAIRKKISYYFAHREIWRYNDDITQHACLVLHRENGWAFLLNVERKRGEGNDRRKIQGGGVVDSLMRHRHENWEASDQLPSEVRRRRVEIHYCTRGRRRVGE
jgi:hypothetical protein